MDVKFAVKKKITVNGREYESLDQVPEEFRAAVRNALESGAVPKTAIYFNGKREELPAPLQSIVAGAASLALRRMAEAKSVNGDAERPPDTAAEPLRPKPVLSVKTMVFLLGLAGLLFWLARLVR